MFDVVSDVPGIDIGRADCCIRTRSHGLSELARTHSMDIAPADALIAYFERHPTAFVPADLDMPWPGGISRQAVHERLYRW